jgi:hypothetical protein
MTTNVVSSPEVTDSKISSTLLGVCQELNMSSQEMTLLVAVCHYCRVNLRHTKESAMRLDAN